MHSTLRYHDVSRRLAAMTRDKPISSRDRLVRYIEFTARYGPINNYDIAGNRLNFLQYYSLDIIVPVFIVFIIVVYLYIRFVILIGRFVVGRCLSKKFFKKSE